MSKDMDKWGEEAREGMRAVRQHPNYERGDVRIWLEGHALNLLNTPNVGRDDL